MRLLTSTTWARLAPMKCLVKGYARVETSHGAAASGALAMPADVSISIPVGTTVTHLGYWEALTGGNFIGYTDITDDPLTLDGASSLLPTAPY